MDKTIEKEGWIACGVLLVISAILLTVGFRSDSSFVTLACVLVAVVLLVILSRMVWWKLRHTWEVQQAQRKKAARAAELNQKAKDGTWDFPAEEFFLYCRDSHVTALDNEYSVQKAKLIAEELIREKAPQIDIANCGSYLQVPSMKSILKIGEELAMASATEAIARMCEPEFATPTEAEKTFLKRAVIYSRLHGAEKRVQMLKNLYDDYTRKIIALREGEQALQQLGIAMAHQQKKETSWAVMGVTAEGITGPGAGNSAAVNTVANNEMIRIHNEQIRKATVDMMSGLPGLSVDIAQLEKERQEVGERSREASRKIILTKPTAGEIWKNFRPGEVVIRKKPSGVLTISLPVTLKEPFKPDVPDGVRMVVDGTLTGEVWFEDVYVGGAVFPLPLNGIPTDMTGELVLEGLCGRSVGADGGYTVKMGYRQNLWIMEA